MWENSEFCFLNEIKKFLSSLFEFILRKNFRKREVNRKIKFYGPHKDQLWGLAMAEYLNSVEFNHKYICHKLKKFEK